MFDGSHVSDRVGNAPQRIRCVATCRHNTHMLGLLGKGPRHIGTVDLASIHGIGNLVEHDEAVLARHDPCPRYCPRLRAIAADTARSLLSQVNP